MGRKAAARRIGAIARLILAAMLMVVLAAPESGFQVLGPTPALADDDGGDDGDDGDRGARSDRGGRDRAGSSRSPRVARQARAPSRSTVVALGLPDAAQAAVLQRGFVLLADARLDAIQTRMQRFRVPADMSVAAGLRFLRERGASQADVNATYRPQAKAGEACGEGRSCTPFEMISWPGGGDAACDADPSVGLVETAVDLESEALAGQDVTVLDLKPEGRRQSGTPHGTAVAALISGARNGPAEGLLPDARLLIAVPYYRNSRGNDIAEVFDVVRAIDALIARGPHVVNLSLSGPYNAVLEQVVGAAVGRGIAVVAAAGNPGATARPLYPAAFDSVVAVTAEDGATIAAGAATMAVAVDTAAAAAAGMVVVTKSQIHSWRGSFGRAMKPPEITAKSSTAVNSMG